MGLSPHFTGGEGKGEMNDGGSHVVIPQEITAQGFVFGSCKAQTYVLSRTNDGRTGELV